MLLLFNTSENLPYKEAKIALYKLKSPKTESLWMEQ